MEIQADGKILSIDSHDATIIAYSKIQQGELPTGAVAGYLVFKDEAEPGSKFDVRLKHIGYVYMFSWSGWGYKLISKPEITFLKHGLGHPNREDAVGALIEAQAFSI